MSRASADDLLRSLPSHIERDTDPKSLSAYATDESGRRGVAPLTIVRPHDTSGVQAVVKWAAESGHPLVPVSSPDGPRRRGDTVSDRASIILDVSFMNRIVHVDSRDAVAIIEPGVTFPAFNRALKEHGLRSFQPLAPRGSKSVLTTFLEREPMTVPSKHWDVADPLAALEVVFGTGDLFRTGGAGLPGDFEKNLASGNRNLIAVGPSFTDFGRVMGGSQGALGVTTWASILCQRLPAAEVPLFATGADLGPVVELCYRMLRRRLAGQMFILNGLQLALLLANDPDEFAALKTGLPAWTLYVELSASSYFPDEAIAYQRADLERDAAALGVQVSEVSAGRPAASLPERQRSFPEVAAHRRAGLVCQEAFGLSQLDAASAQGEAIQALCKGRAELAIYLQPTNQGASVHCQYTLLARPGSEAELSRLAVQAAGALADNRGFLSRPYHPWAHIPFERDPGVAEILDRAKQLFDPSRILKPGAMSLGGAK